MAELDTTLIPFENPYVSGDDAVIQSFDTELLCPDGSPSRFHVVYRSEQTEPAPAAIVLHSGAFDYVLEHGEDGPLSGPHYHSKPRLTQEFGVSKVWETLGLQVSDLDPAEQNLGTLPAALTNRNVVQILPGNCWGDLWHNEEGVQFNEIEEEGFSRNGRAFAAWMVRMATDADFAADQGIEITPAIDPDSIYLVGLGDGGRGVLELLNHPSMPAFRGAMVDSSPDNLAAFTAQPTDFQDEIDGLRRIFGTDNLANIGEFSLANADVELPPRFYYLWSSTDPQLPQAAMAPAADALQDQMGVRVHDTATQAHVLSNSDMGLANEAVEFLLD
jgi:hypothetical protein